MKVYIPAFISFLSGVLICFLALKSRFGFNLNSETKQTSELSQNTGAGQDSVLVTLVDHEARVADLLEAAADRLLSGESGFSLNSVSFLKDLEVNNPGHTRYLLQGDVNGVLDIDGRSRGAAKVVFVPGRGDWGCKATRILMDL